MLQDTEDVRLNENGGEGDDDGEISFDDTTAEYLDEAAAGDEYQEFPPEEEEADDDP
jgi:hypothetical protein